MPDVGHMPVVPALRRLALSELGEIAIEVLLAAGRWESGYNAGSRANRPESSMRPTSASCLTGQVVESGKAKHQSECWATCAEMTSHPMISNRLPAMDTQHGN